MPKKEKKEKSNVEKWHQHGKVNHPKTAKAAVTRDDAPEEFYTPTQQRLMGWAEKWDGKLDDPQAEEELRNLGFDPDHPPM